MIKKFAYTSFIFVFMFFINSFSQSIQDFTIQNNTGMIVYDVYVAYAGEDEWGDDLMSQDVLGDGESLMVNFSGYDFDACFFDVMIGDLDGNYYVISDVDLCTVVTLTFTPSNVWQQEESEYPSNLQEDHLPLEEILTAYNWDMTYNGESYGKITFNSDGSVSLDRGMGDESGTWNLNDDKLNMDMPDAEGKWSVDVDYEEPNLLINYMGIKWIYKPL